MNKVMCILSISLFLLALFPFAKKLIWNKIAPVKTIKAEVIDKYKPDIISKYPKSFKPESYIIVFKVKDKKLLFNVSPFSYSNYRIKEKGTLKYKGDRIISFK